MNITEFVTSRAVALENKFRNDSLKASCWRNTESDFYVIQVPGCDDLEGRSRKFRAWKRETEEEALTYPQCVLVTDNYRLNETFKRIY